MNMSNWGKPIPSPYQDLLGNNDAMLKQLAPDIGAFATAVPSQGSIPDWAAGTSWGAGAANAGSNIPGMGAWNGFGGGGSDDSLWSKFTNSGFFGKTDTKSGIKTDGWGGTAIAGAKGLFDAFNSYKTGKLAEKSFALSKEVAQANLNGAKQSYNTQLRDKRADAFGNAAADEYMKTNRIA